MSIVVVHPDGVVHPEIEPRRHKDAKKWKFPLCLGDFVVRFSELHIPLC